MDYVQDYGRQARKVEIDTSLNGCRLSLLYSDLNKEIAGVNCTKVPLDFQDLDVKRGLSAIYMNIVVVPAFSNNIVFMC